MLIGVVIWHNKFNFLRSEINVLIKNINTYKNNHGQYPENLYLLQSVEKIEKIGSNKIKLQYKKKLNNYELTYFYGWYFYSYNSFSNIWVKSD